MKKREIAFLLMFVFAISLVLCISYFAAGDAAVVYNGFAVDDTGRVYIGRSSQIDIYEQGEKIGEVDTVVGRGYAFTIENGRLKIGIGGKIREMDLDGQNEIQYEDPYSRFNHRYTENRSFTDTQGKVYEMSRPWGRLQITCQGETVYQMPLADCFVMYAMVLYFVAMGTCIAVCAIDFVRENAKMQKQKNMGK